MLYCSHKPEHTGVAYETIDHQSFADFSAFRLQFSAGGYHPHHLAPHTYYHPTTAPLPTQPPILEGWVEQENVWYYYVENQPLTGWQTLEEDYYFFQPDGSMHTGFLEFEDSLYYFHPDGTMATGEVTVDGRKYFFTAAGKQILLVNPWNTVPEDYTPQLVEVDRDYAVSDMYVDASCIDALLEMLKDCNRLCPAACVVSAYRTEELQTALYENKIQRVMAATGLPRDKAAIEAAKEVAIPNTSEHQLGLAVDIVDTRDWSLELNQAELPAQQWLMENSWRYGFILRYPANKTQVTGILYEPWHYRDVGKELAAALYASNLTLEEYLQNLTK